MTKIALTAAAILVATGSAFAGSDHYGSNNASQPVASQSTSVDHMFTGSILKSEKAQADANAKVPGESGQGIWGR
ncbi:DUF680 domain-containing protein [Mesorhizobium caraganae]|uniref:DUF680 domain-containing protein n=1 Tax=Mesorhizobium caraganae TaxID=483206 RepID=UPI001939FC6F|nr:DUF680 domain-containing protein [Mesorhizobium caraganae]MBM2711462.1 DUF680 domain-containing protein [Mesorhizobium caraganae]